MSPQRQSAAYRKALGKAIRERRHDLGSSQEDVAADAEIDRTYMSGLEAGDRNPTLESIMRVAGAMGLKPSELLADAERRLVRRRR